MESNDKLNEINIKNCMRYYFDDDILIFDLILILIDKNRTKMFYFITFIQNYDWF